MWQWPLETIQWWTVPFDEHCQEKKIVASEELSTNNDFLPLTKSPQIFVSGLMPLPRVSNINPLYISSAFNVYRITKQIISHNANATEKQANNCHSFDELKKALRHITLAYRILKKAAYFGRYWMSSRTASNGILIDEKWSPKTTLKIIQRLSKCAGYAPLWTLIL